MNYLTVCSPVMVVINGHRLGICGNIIDAIDIADRSRLGATVVRIRDGAILYQTIRGGHNG